MLEKIFELIEIYFKMNPGEHIKNFQEEIVLLESEIKIVMRRRALKHIVEQRKKDTYTVNDFKKLFTDLNNILIKNNFVITKNKSEDENSFLLIETTEIVGKGVVVAMEHSLIDKNFYFIKTGFYRSATKIKNLLDKIK